MFALMITHSSDPGGLDTFPVGTPYPWVVHSLGSVSEGGSRSALSGQTCSLCVEISLVFSLQRADPCSDVLRSTPSVSNEYVPL